MQSQGAPFPLEMGRKIKEKEVEVYCLQETLERGERQDCKDLGE